MTTVTNDLTMLTPTPGAERNNMEHTESARTEVSVGATTGFIADAEVVSNSPNLFVPIQTESLSMTDPIRQELVTFFEKPIILSTGTLSSSDTATSMFTCSLFRTLLTKTIYNQKLIGFFGFKANVKLRMVVNANPFQQGRYILGYVPLGGANTAQATCSNAIVRSKFSIVQVTQLPHVEIDLACDTAAELTVPFISCEPFYPLRQLTGSQNYGEIAHLFIRPYRALQSGTGSSTAVYTLWASFENVQLIAPTVPQSDWRNRFDKASKYAKKANSSVPYTEQERDALKVGPVSSVAKTVSAAAKYLAFVPGLETAGNIVGWGADIVGNVASAFGWSRPLNLALASYMQRLSYPYFNNVDGVENSKPVALTTTNALENIDFTGSSADELSFNFLKGIPAFVSYVEWTPARVQNYDLVVYPVGPLSAQTVLIDAATTTYNGPPFVYFSLPFQLWRGGFILKFKFVKTKFHSGRLLFSYYPSDNRNPYIASPSLDDTNFIFREIIDIRETNEVTFELPYVQGASYTDINEHTGVAHLKVLDPLVSPDTVYSNVGIILEVSAAPDYEVAVPRPIDACVFTPLLAQMDDCALGSIKFGNAKYDLENFSARACIGEKITSLRQILRLKGNIGYRSLSASNVDSNSVTYTPYIRQACYGIITQQNKSDHFNFFGPCFALERGSMILTTTSQDSINWSLIFTNKSTRKLIPAEVGLDATSYFDKVNTSVSAYPPVVGNTDVEGNISVTIPYFNKWSCHPVSETVYSGSVLTPSFTTQTTHIPTRESYLISTSSTNRLVPYRSIGEDYGLGCFVSCPPYVGSNQSFP